MTVTLEQVRDEIKRCADQCAIKRKTTNMERVLQYGPLVAVLGLLITVFSSGMTTASGKADDAKEEAKQAAEVSKQCQEKLYAAQIDIATIKTDSRHTKDAVADMRTRQIETTRMIQELYKYQTRDN